MRTDPAHQIQLGTAARHELRERVRQILASPEKCLRSATRFLRGAHPFPESASKIAPTDIEDLRVFDRYHAEPGAGLRLRIHAGRGIAGGTLRYHYTLTDLMLPPNATTALWQRASGAWELAAPTAPPPETALGPLWIATTAAGGVTELLDRRVFAADPS